MATTQINRQDGQKSRLTDQKSYNKNNNINYAQTLTQNDPLGSSVVAWR